ncbi:MAG: nucleotide exchange factor GrpE [Clostridiaceae bacterium]|nr:nucleotide exchange factor GrpE [Clostridiaceae bacterium]
MKGEKIISKVDRYKCKEGNRNNENNEFYENKGNSDNKRNGENKVNSENKRSGENKENSEGKGQEAANAVSNTGENEAMELIDEMGQQEKVQKEKEQQVIEQQETEIEIEGLRVQLQEARAKCDEYFNMLQRVAAEFDNYKKRTQREKETYRKEITCEIVASFIPVLDNLERALNAVVPGCDANSIREGIELVYSQFCEILGSLGVEPIKCVGEKFDPNLHDAVMHINDEAYGENVVVEELRKGYMVEDRVIRHSMVKVAN